jgi:hypothetical protein
MSFEEAYELIGRDEAFRATIYAMNTLLTDKGVYTAEEFQALFIEYGINFKRRFPEKVLTKADTPDVVRAHS